MKTFIIYKKFIGLSLTSVEGLNMQEAIGKFTGKKIGPTFFRESKPIDGVCATSNLIVTHACIMPIGFGVDNHHMYIIDFQESSMVGAAPFRVQRFISRRLNTKVSKEGTQKYVERLEVNIAKHCLIEKLGILHTQYSKRRPQQELNKLDQQSRDFMLSLEKKCPHAVGYLVPSQRYNMIEGEEACRLSPEKK
jgi:hypothetical protein